MTQTTQHVHKLRRHTYKTGSAVYFCALPDCPFKIAPALALGKRAICWRCGEPFILNEYAIRLAKPHCEACHKPKTSNPSAYEQAEQILDMTDVLAKTPTIPSTAPVSDLRSRLNSILHSGLAAKADDEGDI